MKKEFRPPTIWGAPSNQPLKWTVDHHVMSKANTSLNPTHQLGDHECCLGEMV